MSRCDSLTIAERERCARIVEDYAAAVEGGIGHLHTLAKRSTAVEAFLRAPVAQRLLADCCRAFLSLAAEEIRRG